jgi:hypothetical protein
MVKDGVPSPVYYIDWFTPGTTHHYRIRYYGSGIYGKRWRVWIDYSYVGEWQSTYCVSGWSSVAGERKNCGGNAEYTYCEKWNGSSWTQWVDPNDWDWLGPFKVDTDDFYEFRGNPPNSNSCWIRPN